MSNNIFQRYWVAYGGFSALIKSRYLWFSFFLTCLLYPHWSNLLWWEDVIAIMPNLLGFSLGGFAMWLAIGDDDFRKIICKTDENSSISPYMEINATFVHFIFLQIVSIFLALIAKVYSFSLPGTHWILVYFGEYYKYFCLSGYFFSYLIFIYALTSSLATTLALLRVSSWYNTLKSKE